jgi:hypothetical protein
MKPKLVSGILDGYRGQAGAPGDGSLSPGWQAEAEDSRA